MQDINRGGMGAFSMCLPVKEGVSLFRTMYNYAFHGKPIDRFGHCVMLHYAYDAGKCTTCCRVPSQITGRGQEEGTFFLLFFIYLRNNTVYKYFMHTTLRIIHPMAADNRSIASV